MLEESPNEPACPLRQAAVALLVEEEVLAVFPQGNVGVHPGAVVAKDWLGHEGRSLVVSERRVLDDVLELQQVVGGCGEAREPVVDFLLPGGCDLVVGTLYLQARPAQVV